MSSPMRWGDSDSSDEEAYVPSKKPQQEDDIHEVIADDPDDVEVVAEPAPTHRPRNDRGHNRHDQYHDSHRRGGTVTTTTTMTDPKAVPIVPSSVIGEAAVVATIRRNVLGIGGQWQNQHLGLAQEVGSLWHVALKSLRLFCNI